MDIGKAISFITEDERWVTKVLLGGALMLIPIVGWLAAYGIMVKTARNVANGVPNPLPEPFENFGENIMQGLYVFLIMLVYALPGLILYFLFFCLVGGAASLSDGSDAAGAGVGILGCIIMPLYILLLLVGSFLAYAAIARFVVSNQLSDAMKIGEVIAQVRAKPGPWLMLFLLAFIAGIISGVGGIACGIGALFTGFYAMGILGHGLGQTIRSEGMMGSGYGNTPSYTPPPPPYTPMQ